MSQTEADATTYSPPAEEPAPTAAEDPTVTNEAPVDDSASTEPVVEGGTAPPVTVVTNDFDLRDRLVEKFNSGSDIGTVTFNEVETLAILRELGIADRIDQLNSPPPDTSGSERPDEDDDDEEDEEDNG